MTRLWDKGAPLDARVLHYTAGEDYALDERLVRYDVRASIAHAEMLRGAGAAVGSRICEQIRDGPHGARRRARARPVAASSSPTRMARRALERRLTARIGAAGGRIHLGARATTRC